MFCPKCGVQVNPGSSYCQKCGAAVSQPVVAQPQAVTAPPMPGQVVSGVKTSGMAVASLVLGITGLVIIPFITSILAIIFGVIGLGQIKRSNGAITGKGMAVAGLILGIIGIVFTILIVVLIGYSFSWLSDLSNGIHY
jgi:hypothetical protein